MSRAIDTESPSWKAIAAWAEGRLSASRAAIEAHGLDLQQTEYQRGRIAMLRELLKLPTPNRIDPAHSAEHVE